MPRLIFLHQVLSSVSNFELLVFRTIDNGHFKKKPKLLEHEIGICERKLLFHYYGLHNKNLSSI